MNVRKGLICFTFVLSLIAGIWDGRYAFRFSGNTFPPPTATEDLLRLLLFVGLFFTGVWAIYVVTWFIVKVFTIRNNPAGRKDIQE